MSDQENSSGTEDEKVSGQQGANNSADDDDKAWEQSQGSGGKAAVLADLHRERTQRQQLATENESLKAFKDSLTKLLGGKEDLDPEKLARELTATKSENDQARKLLEVYKAAPVGVDVNAMVDSVSFREGLAAATDPKAYVEDFLKKNPRFAGTSDDTARNLAQGNGRQPKGKTFDDTLRGLR